jgi:hypothetical protein
LQCRALLRELDALRIPRWELFRSDLVVAVRSNQLRYDLLILHALPPDPERHPNSTPINVSPTPADLMQGWANFANAIQAAPAFDAIGAAIAAEALDLKHPFGAVIAPRPETELVLAPPSPWIVKPVSSSLGDSSAGVTAVDKKKRSGVTAALHAVGSSKAVTVDGVNGTVVRRNKISDSCFIEVTMPAPGSKGSKGPLVNTLPRGNQLASYDGSASQKNTNITGWDLATPNVTKHSQLRVYTPRVTHPGDSGAALISDDNYVVGFAFERTGRSKIPEYSSWIWADSVYTLLKLEH